MLKNSKSQNLIVSSVKAASIAFSIVTIMTGAIVGIVSPKDKLASQIGVYASLIGTGCGAIFGLVVGDKPRKKKSTTDIDRER